MRVFTALFTGLLGVVALFKDRKALATLCFGISLLFGVLVSIDVRGEGRR